MVPPTHADDATITVNAGGESFQFATYDFPPEHHARLQKFLERVAALDWSKSTELHDRVFGGPAGGATYLRYLATHARGFAFTKLTDRVTTFRPPFSARFYAWRKWVSRIGNGRPGTVALGAYFFKDDGPLAFIDQLYNLIQSARTISRYGYVPCSTAQPSLDDMLQREGTGEDKDCESEIGGPISLGVLLTMAAQLNEPDLKLSVGALNLGSYLTGEARKEINADIRASALFAKITSLVLVMNKGDGRLEYRACPVPPQMRGRVQMDQDACPVLAELNLSEESAMSVTAPDSVNTTQMNAILEDAREVMAEEPGQSSARVVQRAVAKALTKARVE